MTIQLIDPGLIDPNPYNSRSSMNGEDLQLLAEDIKKNNLLQPPTVRQSWTATGRYQLAFGHRRHAAWLIARPGEAMPVNVIDLDDRQMFEYAAVENVHVPLSAIEKARHMQRYMQQFSATEAQAGALYHLRQTSVSNLLRLLRLPEPIQQHIQDGNLPERLARQLVPLTAFPVEKQLEQIAKAISKAPASAREEIAEKEIGDVIMNYCRRLDSNGWPKEWKPDVAVDGLGPDGSTEIPPACTVCPLYLVNREGIWCGRPLCHAAKYHLWSQRELERLSQKLGIPIARDGDTAIKLSMDYNNDDRARELLRSKSCAEIFRLMPNDGQHNYYHEQVLGSNAAILAAFDPKLLDRKTGQPVPQKTADETPAKKALREAAEERERDKRRNEKASLRKARADIFWLVSHTAQVVSPIMIISGGILEFAEDVSNHRFQSSHPDWPEMQKFRQTLERETGKAKDNARESLLRQRLIVSEANRELNAFRPEEQFSWPRALGKVEYLITKTFKLVLPAGWDQPPIHRTPSNCWVCGRFTSMDHITKIDEAAGWRTAADGTVTCSDKCRKSSLTTQNMPKAKRGRDA